VFFVKGPDLKAVQLQSESRAHLLQVGTRAIFVELVPVVPEKDEVSLVVHRDHAAGLEVRLLRD
jgi:hypothetical protein